MPRTVVLGRDLTPQQAIILLNTLGGRIAFKRHEHNVTQEWLAEKVNVSQSLVSRWERNRERPLHDSMVKLAEALQTTREWLTAATPITSEAA